MKVVRFNELGFKAWKNHLGIALTDKLFNPFKCGVLTIEILAELVRTWKCHPNNVVGFVIAR
mgnify:CR=1